MKKIVLGLGVLIALGLTSCEQGSSARYEPINRKNAMFLVDKETGEVFMMSIVVEKGKGVTGSKWRKMGDPSMAE